MKRQHTVLSVASVVPLSDACCMVSTIDLIMKLVVLRSRGWRGVVCEEEEVREMIVEVKVTVLTRLLYRLGWAWGGGKGTSLCERLVVGGEE